MLVKKPSLRVTLAATIFLIGLLGLMLVVSTEHIYRKFALEHQESAFEALLTIKTDDLIKELIDHQKELGFRLQSEEEFKSAYNSRNTADLIYWLDQEFNRYFVTIGLLKLEKIIVYDGSLTKLASSERGISMNNLDTTPCSALIKSCLMKSTWYT